MNFCLFLTASIADPTAPREPADDAPALSRFAEALRAVPGLTELAVHRGRPAVRDPSLREADGPDAAVQLYFDDLLALERALDADGPVRRAFDASVTPAFAGAWTQQAMAVRRYLGPDDLPAAKVGASSSSCTYLVSYEGQARDDDAWVRHYLRHHPPLMLRLPGLRRLEVYTRLAVGGGLPLPMASSLQRNLVAFDSAEALGAALASPARAALRADYEAFPPFVGRSPHRAMDTQRHPGRRPH